MADTNPYSQPEQSDAAAAAGKGCLSWWSLLLMGGFLLVLFGLFVLPMGRRSREVATRAQCRLNLKQIGLAFYNYHDVYDSFPPALTTDATGQPLHSWRTLILPYLEQQALYNSIDLNRPWNDPANQQAAQTRMEVYHCPSSNIPDNHTTYLAVTGENTCFPPERGRPLHELGTEQYLMVSEVPTDQSVPWMSPNDAVAATLMNMDEDSQTAHQGGVQGLFADGHVQFLGVSQTDAEWQEVIVVPETREPQSAGDK